MRIRLVVLKFDVVTRLVLFDERRFEDQCFDFVVSNDEFEIGDLTDERIGFAVKRPRAKVRTHAAAQVLRLADIDHLSRRIFVQIDAGRRRNFFEFFLNCHDVEMLF